MSYPFIRPTAPTAGPKVFTASQELMDTLLLHGFVSSEHHTRYVSGRIYYFKKHGDLMVSFLKDGRVHTLAGPVAMWQLHDGLSEEELRVLCAFSCMSENNQVFFRQFMSKKETPYEEVLNTLPGPDREWSAEFREHYSRLLMTYPGLRQAI